MKLFDVQMLLSVKDTMCVPTISCSLPLPFYFSQLIMSLTFIGALLLKKSGVVHEKLWKLKNLCIGGQLHVSVLLTGIICCFCIHRNAIASGFNSLQQMSPSSFDLVYTSPQKYFCILWGYVYQERMRNIYAAEK